MSCDARVTERRMAEGWTARLVLLVGLWVERWGPLRMAWWLYMLHLLLLGYPSHTQAHRIRVGRTQKIVNTLMLIETHTLLKAFFFQHKFYSCKSIFNYGIKVNTFIKIYAYPSFRLADEYSFR